jgi:hypothetical protein
MSLAPRHDSQRSFVEAAAPVIILTLVGATSAFIYRVWGHGPAIDGGGEAYVLARSLALHGTFADPFAGLAKTGPSAHLTPLFPAFLAAIMWISDAIFGPATFFLALLAQGLNAALLPALSRRFFGTPRPGWIAAAAVILLPVYQLYPTWDAMYSANVLMLGILLLFFLFDRGPANAVKGAVAGLLTAFMFLFNPACGLVLVVFLIWIPVRSTGALLNSSVPYLAAAMGVAILGISPWIIRNYVTFGRFVPLRDCLGIALYTSNNSCAQATLEANLLSGCHQATDPIGSASENRLVAQMGEVAYNEDRTRKATAWMEANPSRFVSLTAQRIRYFWFPQRQPAVWLVTACGFAGLILLLLRERPMGVVFLIALLAYSSLYYLIGAEERYLYPCYWCVCLCAGYFAASLAKWSPSN